MGLVQDKVVVVTGGGSGIGRAACEIFAREGAAHVRILDLDEKGARETAALVEAAGATAHVARVDVTDESQVSSAMDSLVADQGRVDAAFNNAGISDGMVAFHEMELDKWQRMLDVNLTGVFLCMKHELRHLVENEAGGAIVNTSSGAGHVPAPGQPHYTAAKHGVIGITKCAAQDYIRRGIRVNAVLPGTVDTPMLRGFIGGDPQVEKMMSKSTIIGRMLDPEEIAENVVWLCSDGASMVNAQSIVIDGGGVIR